MQVKNNESQADSNYCPLVLVYSYQTVFWSRLYGQFLLRRQRRYPWQRTLCSLPGHFPPYVLPFCTLRAAIEETNDLPGNDVILLQSGVYALSIAGINENASFSGDLDLTDSLTIIGAGPDETTIDGDGLDRIFDLVSPNTTVSISGVTIRNGNLPVDSAMEHKGGGGIRNFANLALSNTVITNNQVQGTEREDAGGGILNLGICYLTQSSLHHNTAHQGGGIANDYDGVL